MPLRDLSVQLQKKSEEELNEVPSQVKTNLTFIKEWILKQPHLKCRLDDQWLISFLRGCKFSLEKTKEKLDYFYTMRSLDNEIFSNRDPFSLKIQEFLAAGYIVPLPKSQDPTAPRTILIHTPNYDPDTMTPALALKAFLMSLDILLNNDDSFVIAGQQILLNVASFDYRILLQLTPTVIRKIYLYLLNGYPTRPKRIHILNSPPIYEAVLGLIKTLVSNKINRRIKLYKEEDVPDIYKSIPRSILPIEYGGSVGTIKELAGQWKREVEGYHNWFIEDAKYGVEEDRRITRPRITADLIGVEGSFRTLIID